MINTQSSYENVLMRLLISDGINNAEFHDFLTSVDWNKWQHLAASNVILIRSYDALSKYGIKPPAAYHESVLKEINRINHTMGYIENLSKLCSQNKINCLFPKASQHYPDMGHDIDLFVLDESQHVDKIIQDNISLSPGKSSFGNRISGKSSYQFESLETPLEIHHGRMGHVGEHWFYPKLVAERKKMIEINGYHFYTPSSEDQLITQVLQRIYGHFYIRISDIIHTLNLVRTKTLDWDYILNTCNQIGIQYGLISYLSLVNSLLKESVDINLSDYIKLRLLKKNSMVPIFRNGSYHLPLFSIVGKSYLYKLFSDIVHCNWRSLQKIIMIPAFALVVGFRYILRAGVQYEK